MSEVYEISGLGLAELLRELQYEPDRIYKVSIFIDDGVKVKINEGIWSLPMGQRRK